MRVPLRLSVNGMERRCQVLPNATLQEVLHDELGHSEVRKGCGEGVCGACTVTVGGELVASCLALAVRYGGAELETARALSSGDTLVENLVANEAFQCGYCAPGILMSARTLLSAHAARGEAGVLSEDEVKAALAGHLCRCSGYQQMIEAIIATSEGRQLESRGPARGDLSRKILGLPMYPSDASRPGLLHGRIVWSEHPAAHIRGVRTSEAAAVPGVVCVLTARHIPGENIGGTQLFGADQPLLAEDEVRCMGDAIALIAAETESAAERARALVQVDYSPRPPLLDAADPAAQVVTQFSNLKGDVGAAFAEADVVVEGQYQTRPQDHACLEREGGVGWWEGDTLVLTVTTLTPHVVRQSVARALGLEENAVRIETPRMGGSFGKYLMQGVESHLALLVYATRRPVRLVLERHEIIERSPKRHAFMGSYRLAARRDGTFLGLEAEVIADAGPYVAFTPTVVAVFADEVTGAYEFPHVRARAIGVRTNNLVAAAMRGYGSQQIHFGIESIVEKLAHELGLDPTEVRFKNARGRAMAPKGEGQKTLVPLQQTISLLRQRLAQFPAPAAVALPEGWKVGRGYASVRAKYGYPYGFVDRFLVRVTLTSDNQCLLEHDIADSGTGIGTALARLVAKELGRNDLPQVRVLTGARAEPSGVWLTTGKMPGRFKTGLFTAVEEVQVNSAKLATQLTARLRFAVLVRLLGLGAPVLSGLTAWVARVKAALFPHGSDAYLPRTSGSRGVAMSGRAALSAAEQLKEKILALASRKLAAPVSELELGHDVVTHRNGRSRVRLVDLLGDQELSAVGHATLPEGPLLERGTGNQSGSVDYMMATHACDVAVDPKTGTVRIIRYVACQDVGAVLDPETLRGQLLGGVTMGISQALLEDLELQGGRVNARGLHGYRIPTSLDITWNTEILLLESGEGMGPRGAKGVGEVGAVAGPAAVANAIYDALGAQPAHVVFTPEDVVRLAQRAQEGDTA